MIFNVCLYKNIRFIRIFKSGSLPTPDKISSFHISNPDFSEHLWVSEGGGSCPVGFKNFSKKRLFS